MFMLIALIACAADPYVLDGVWTGYAECGVRAAWEITLAAVDDAGEFEGRGQVHDHAFTLRLEIPSNTAWDATSAAVEADVDDCADDAGEALPCWTATAVSSPALDTLTGTFSGFPVGGDCTWDLERPFYP